VPLLTVAPAMIEAILKDFPGSGDITYTVKVDR
jgi:hypothetical protein